MTGLALSTDLPGRPGSPPDRPHVMAPWRLKRALAFIEAVLHEPITLADIAGAAGLSVFHFARCFKRETGLSPYRYLIARRLARAEALLSGSDDSITAIALNCGFASQQQFTTIFRRNAGLPPARWRRAGRQASDGRTARTGNAGPGPMPAAWAQAAMAAGRCSETTASTVAPRPA